MLNSQTIKLRLIEESDAEFVLGLRCDAKLNKYLSPVQGNIQQQIEFIRNYKKDEHAGRQFYFIIERRDNGVRCGTVRLYDFKGKSFCWGSWILNQDKTRMAALESALLVYEYGFEILGFESSHFEVAKANDKVISFHERLGALRTKEDEINIYFNITAGQFKTAKTKLEIKLKIHPTRSPNSQPTGRG